MSKRTLGRFVAQSELQMRRRQLIQPVPCWEYKWVAISSNSTVRLRQWVKTDKKQVINAALCLCGIVAMDFQRFEPTVEQFDFQSQPVITRLLFTSLCVSL